MIFHIQVPPDRGRSHETHANGEGCGACGSGLVSRASGGLGSHRPAQLRGSVRQRAGGADERRGEKSCGMRELSDCGSFRLQKAVLRSKEKRRGEAPIGAPVRVVGRLFPSAEGTGFAVRRPPGAAIRTSACRRFAPLGWGTSQTAAGRTLHRNDGVCSMRHDQRQTGRSDW